MTDASALSVTDAAFAELARIVAADGGDKPYLRLAVLGGGCSGFQYQFDLTAKTEADDLVIARDGVGVLVDSVSQPFLAGSALDFKRELIGARFVVENPNASSTCGCGTSFSV